MGKMVLFCSKNHIAKIKIESTPSPIPPETIFTRREARDYLPTKARVA